MTDYVLSINLGVKKEYSAWAILERLHYLEGKGWSSARDDLVIKDKARRLKIWNQWSKLQSIRAQDRMRSSFGFGVAPDLIDYDPAPRLTPDAPDKDHYACVVLERFTLSMGSYAQIAKELGEIIKNSNLTADDYSMVIQQTDVGPSVVDIFREEFDAWISTVTVTNGTDDAKVNNHFKIPRRDLLYGLNSLLETGRLEFAKNLPLRDTVIDELSKVRIKKPTSNDDLLGRDHDQPHDDLVIALAIGCWMLDNNHAGGWLLF